MEKKIVDIFGTRDHIVELIRMNSKLKTNHAALLYWIEQKSNKSFWSPEIYLPTDEAISSCGFVAWRTYNKTLYELEELKLVEIVEKSKNIYTPCIIRPLFFRYKNDNCNAEVNKNQGNGDEKGKQKNVKITAELLETIKTLTLNNKIQIDSNDTKQMILDFSSQYLFKNLQVDADLKNEFTELISKINNENPNLLPK